MLRTAFLLSLICHALLFACFVRDTAIPASPRKGGLQARIARPLPVAGTSTSPTARHPADFLRANESAAHLPAAKQRARSKPPSELAQRPSGVRAPVAGRVAGWPEDSADEASLDPGALRRYRIALAVALGGARPPPVAQSCSTVARLAFLRGGQLISVSLEPGCGNAVLERWLVESLQRAAPATGMPDELARLALVLELPLEYAPTD